MVEVAGRPAGDGAMDYDISRTGSRAASIDLLNGDDLAAPLRIVPGLGHVAEDFLNRSIYPDFSLDPHDQILRQCTAVISRPLTPRGLNLRDTARAMSQENVEPARRAFEAWNRGDVDAWVKFHHPEIEWFSEIAGRLRGPETVYRGRAGMREFWDEWHSVWDMTIEIAEFRDYVGEFEEGLVRTLRAYLDPNRALEAVGLSE
jgi:hypothetical protein